MKLCQSFGFFFLQLFLFANVAKSGSLRQQIDCSQKEPPQWDQALHMRAKCRKGWRMAFKSNKQIYTRSYKHIQIKGRKVDGKGEDGAEHAKLAIEANFYGNVMIKGIKSGYYLCLSKTGRLVGRKKLANKKMKRCIYKREYSSKGYIMYESTWRPKWYLAFRSDGTPKPANRSNPKSKSAQFMEIALRTSSNHPHSRYGRRRLLRRLLRQRRLRRQRRQKRLRS